MKFAFITPRYGGEFSTGAEHACRLLAEQICQASRRRRPDDHGARSQSCGRTNTPKDRPRPRRPGPSIRGERDAGASALNELGRRLRRASVSSRRANWVSQVGPWSSGLIEHIKRQHGAYDALVFFGLLHPMTVSGLEIAPERSILFPYLQLQPALRFGLWPDVALAASRGLLLRLRAASGPLLPRSRPAVRRGRRHRRRSAAAAELSAAPAGSLRTSSRPRTKPPPTRKRQSTKATWVVAACPFRRRHRLYGSFALYGGRVEPDNGCEEMLDYFDTYADTARDDAVARADGREDDDGAGRSRTCGMAGVLPDRERMMAYEAATSRLRPATDDLLAQSAARKPGRRNAGARQRRQRSSRRALPPRQRRAVLREPRRVRGGAAAVPANAATAPDAGRERTRVHPADTTDGTRCWGASSAWWEESGVRQRRQSRDPLLLPRRALRPETGRARASGSSLVLFRLRRVPIS